MNRWIKYLGIGLALFGVAAGFTACRHCRSGHGGGWMSARIGSELDLTAEQKTKLEAAQQAFHDARKAHRAERAKQLDEIRQGILADSLDAARIKALMSERHRAFEKDFDAVFGKVADFHASLTPEQKRKAAELVERFASHWDRD